MYSQMLNGLVKDKIRRLRIEIEHLRADIEQNASKSNISQILLECSEKLRTANQIMTKTDD